MTRKTITRATLSEAVYQEVGLSRNESADLLESVLNEITSALAEGDTVKLSSFGSFSIRQKGRRIGRNPKTGEEVPILPRRVLVFRPSQVLKTRINEGRRESESSDHSIHLVGTGLEPGNFQVPAAFVRLLKSQVNSTCRPTYSGFGRASFLKSSR